MHVSTHDIMGILLFGVVFLLLLLFSEPAHPRAPTQIESQGRVGHVQSQRQSSDPNHSRSQWQLVKPQESPKYVSPPTGLNGTTRYYEMQENNRRD